jgi:opacity protein-like surface antigen
LVGQSSKFTGLNAISNFTESVKLPWIATVRGRVGIAIDGALGALLYGTAGVAFTHASASVTTAALGTILNTSSTNVGWTAGLGGEAAFARNWTARIEYLYIGNDVKFSGPKLATISFASESISNILDVFLVEADIMNWLRHVCLLSA